MREWFGIEQEGQPDFNEHSNFSSYSLCPSNTTILNLMAELAFLVLPASTEDGGEIEPQRRTGYQRFGLLQRHEKVFAKLLKVGLAARKYFAWP